MVLPASDSCGQVFTSFAITNVPMCHEILTFGFKQAARGTKVVGIGFGSGAASFNVGAKRTAIGAVLEPVFT